MDKRWALALFTTAWMTLAPNAQARSYHLPLTCPVSRLSLQVSNSSSQAEVFWVRTWNGESFRETDFAAPAGQSKSFLGLEFMGEGESATLIHDSPSLSFILDCEGRTRVQDRVSPQQEFDLRSAQGPLVIGHKNLGPQIQNLQIEFFDSRHKRLISQNEESAAFLSSRRIKLTPPTKAAFLRITSQARQSVLVYDVSTGHEFPARPLPPVELEPLPRESYFLLTDPDEVESFVLTLTDPAEIQQTRQLIASGEPKILWAEIQASTQPGTNRDFHSVDKAPWSWSVTRFLSWSDFGSTSCGGRPQFAEDLLPIWKDFGYKTICFWSWKLKKELSSDEVRRGNLKPSP